MKYEQKAALFATIRQFGVIDKIIAKKWANYTSGKQTYQQLAVKYHCSIRTIQRYIDKAPKTPLKPPSNQYLIIMDTTFFGRYFGVLVLMDSN